MTYEKLIEMIRESLTQLLTVQNWKAGDTIPNDLIMQVLLLGIYDRLGRIQGELEQNLSSIYSAVDEIRDSTHGVPGKW